MKRNNVLNRNVFQLALSISLALLMPFVIGCNPSDEKPVEPKKETAEKSDQQQLAGKKIASDETANKQLANQKSQSEQAAKQPSATHDFEFHYGVNIKDVPIEAKTRVWFPIATSNPQQTVKIVEEFYPAKIETHQDAVYGNQIAYFETSNRDQVSFHTVFQVSRSESQTDDSKSKLDEKQKKLFLSANKLVPTNGRPVELLNEKLIPEDPMDAGKMLFDLVETHMAYDKSKPGYGKGDAIWACDSQTGNCTDFHSLFISLARNQKIPARFEIGFPVPMRPEGEGKIGGYHCWAWFHINGKGWVPVDISEADKNPEKKSAYFGRIPADRVTFSVGRDIVLKPKSASEPQNYFVYPHVEVDGKVWPKEKIELDFRYVDQK